MRVVVVVLLLQLPRPPAHLTKGIQHQGVHIGVQVRNRLWTLERHKHPEQTKWGKSMADQAKRIIDCMDLYVPPIYKVREECRHIHTEHTASSALPPPLTPLSPFPI